MNYIGRVFNQNFSGDFLKEALCKADKKSHLEDQSIINPGIIFTSVMWLEILHGFKVMKKFSVIMLSVFTYFIEKLDSIVFQTIILLIVIFAEIARVAFEHNVMKKKMIAYR